MPIIVKVNKYQRPLLFISCNLLIDTEISGIRRNKLKVKLSPENKTVSRNVSDKNTNISKFINIEFKSSLIKKDVKRDVIITTESTKIRIETLLDLDKLFINLFI